MPIALKCGSQLQLNEHTKIHCEPLWVKRIWSSIRVQKSKWRQSMQKKFGSIRSMLNISMFCKHNLQYCVFV